MRLRILGEASPREVAHRDSGLDGGIRGLGTTSVMLKTRRERLGTCESQNSVTEEEERAPNCDA